MKGWWTGEIALLAVGPLLTALLIVRSSPSPILVEACAITIAYGGLLVFLNKKKSQSSQRLRLLFAYLFTFWFYSGVQRFSPALGFPVQDETLRQLDELIFSEMPALTLQSLSSQLTTEILSLCYLSYHLYMHVILGTALWTGRGLRELGNVLFLAFALGFVGYLFVPAVGPGPAFPGLFHPLPEGYLGAKLNRFVVAQGSSVYDVFPSLHGLLTAVMLAHDYQRHRRRFWIMLGPCTGLLISTLYLRYHYAVDLIAAAGIFLLTLYISHLHKGAIEERPAENSEPLETKAKNHE